MNHYFVAAAVTIFLVGLVHSLLGEKLIFQRLRHKGSMVPSHGGNVLGPDHVRILWATWHIVTVFGWSMGAVLLHVSAATHATARFMTEAIALSALAASLLVFIGTRARHPGWAGLLAVAVFAWLGGI